MTQNLVCNDEAPPPPQTLPAPPPQVLHPQIFSALAAKYTLRDGIELDNDCFAGKEGDESNTDTSDNDTDTSDNDRESGDSYGEVYT